MQLYVLQCALYDLCAKAIDLKMRTYIKYDDEDRPRRISMYSGIKWNDLAYMSCMSL